MTHAANQQQAVSHTRQLNQLLDRITRQAVAADGLIKLYLPEQNASGLRNAQVAIDRLTELQAEFEQQADQLSLSAAERRERLQPTGLFDVQAQAPLVQRALNETEIAE